MKKAESFTRHANEVIFHDMAGMKLAVESRAPQLRDAVAHMDHEALSLLVAEIRDRMPIQDNAWACVPKKLTDLAPELINHPFHTRTSATTHHRVRSKKF